MYMHACLTVCKMNAFPLIIAFIQCVAFLSLDIKVKADVKLLINGSHYKGSNDYYARVGETVQLTCIFPQKTISMVIYKETSSNQDLLVENEELVRSAAERENKYFYHSAGNEHYLNIYRLEISDTSTYGCHGCSKFLCRLFGWWRLKGEPVYLEVTDVQDTPALPDFCELVDRNIHGFFFVGHDLTIRCPTNVTIETDASIQNKIEYKTLNEGSIFNLSLVIKNLTEEFNNTRILCFCARSKNSDERNDYCRHLPNITIFNELLVTLSSDRIAVTNGGNVSFTCRSQPYLPFSVQWDIVDNSVSFGNVSVRQTPSDSQLTVANIDFRNSTSSLTVFCNVTFGSVSSFDTALVQYDSHDVKFTSPVPELSTALSTYTTNMASDPTNMAPDHPTNMAADNGKYSTLSTFTLSVIGVVVIMILAVIILIFVFNKVRKPGKRHGHDRTDNQKTQNTGNGEVIFYNSRDKDKVQLGLTKVDSEVTDNVAYASFETVQSQK